MLYNDIIMVSYNTASIFPAVDWLRGVCIWLITFNNEKDYIYQDI